MYTIVEKNSNQWVSEACIDSKIWKEGDTHFTTRIDNACIFNDRGQAYRAMKKIEKRFAAMNFKTSKVLA